MLRTNSLPPASAWGIDPDPVVAVGALVDHREWPISSVPTRIGRDPSACSICIPEDLRVSKTHAVIEAGERGLVLRDEGSRHGTFVNRVRVNSVELEPGTIWLVGDTYLIALSARMQALREEFRPLLGWSTKHAVNVNYALVATVQRRHVVLSAPMGSFAERIAGLIHTRGPGASQPYIDPPSVPAGAEQRDLLDRAENGTLALPLTQLSAGSLVYAELASGVRRIRVIGLSPPGASMPEWPERALLETLLIHVPPLLDRPGDASLLLPLLVEEHRKRLQDRDEQKVIELPAHHISALARLPWVTVEDLWLAVWYLLALAKHGSVRPTAAAVGLTKSTFGRWLKALETGPIEVAVMVPRPTATHD